MIANILGPLPHNARAVDGRGQDEVAGVLKVLAFLLSERYPVDLKPLYGGRTLCVGHQPAPPVASQWARLSLGGRMGKVNWTPAVKTPASIPSRPAAVASARIPTPGVGVLSSAAALTARAHETFLRLSQNFSTFQTRNRATQLSLARVGVFVSMPR